GSNLRRPECVLTTSCGDLYVSDKRGGVTRISPDGSETLSTGRTADADILAANGFALLHDGSFLVAPLVGGGVFRLQRDGQAELFLQEADGRTLSAVAFTPPCMRAARRTQRLADRLRNIGHWQDLHSRRRWERTHSQR